MSPRIGKMLLVAVAGLVLGWATLQWMGGLDNGSFFGLRVGRYQPPQPPGGYNVAVADEAKRRGLELGEEDAFAHRLGYLDGTDVATVSAQWSAKRDGQDVILRVYLESAGGNKWRVETWNEQ